MQLAEAFAQSEVFSASVRDAKERAVVVRAVRALLARGGVMAEAAFGREMEMLPFRVRGFVSKLQEVLNLDGYSVLRYDPVSRQVQLDKAKLEQLFEVSP